MGTEEEKQNVWLQKDEKSSILKRCKMIIHLAERFGNNCDEGWLPCNGKSICLRGLEKHVGSHGHHRRVIQRAAIEDVLCEQEYQRSLLDFSDEAIAAAYSE